MDLDFGFFSIDLMQRYVLGGLAFSVQLTVIAATGGLLLGCLLALARLSPRRWLAVPAALYVNTMRSVPLVMVILWFFLLMPFVVGRPIGAELSATVTFVAFEAAFFCEIVRSGIQAIPRGQSHAGLALGMSGAQTLRLVVLPQALRNMLPVLLTQVIVLFQDTSLVYAIGAYDLLKGFDVAGKILGRPIEAYVGAALVYLLICSALSRLAARLQRRVAILR
ncbi:MAG: amino acid ABC transporter permease [Burkholderiaceae bacterium]|nr:amino acid ABC transporter permease [Burkholderiaceae bacterium]